MSRALAEAERRPLDFYATPDALALAICQRLKGWVPTVLSEIIEPSAGGGAFVRAARATWPDAPVLAVDVVPTPEDTHGADLWVSQDWVAFADSVRDVGGPRLILGNPPYRQAQAHVVAALEMMAPGDTLAFLLRINFLGSLTRVGFWQQCPLEALFPIVPRPSFTGGGTDGTEYGLFLWRQGWTGEARLPKPILWSPGRSGEGGGR